MWTDTLDKTLEKMKQNVKQLTSNYWDNYEFTKNFVMYINAPLVILSAFNAYAILELEPAYGRPIHIATAATSIVTAVLLSGEIIVASKRKVTESLQKVKVLDQLHDKISTILSQEADKRTEDANEFIAKVMKEYRNITKDDKTIVDNGGNMRDTESEEVEDVQGYLDDHWNILYRPKFHKIKLKNRIVMQMFEKTGKTLEDIVSMVIGTVKSEDKKEESEDIEAGDDKEAKKSFQFSDIYPQFSIPTLPSLPKIRRSDDSDSEEE